MNLTIDEILRRHLQGGESFASLGEAAGVTGERVRQVVRRAGVTTAQSREATRATVGWVCRGCGAFHETAPSRARVFCGRECRKVDPESFDPLEAARFNRHDGHYWISHPVSGKKVRVERYLAEKKAGRPLRSDEWVVILDGNPANFASDNIAVMSPREVHEFYSRNRGAA